MAITFTLTVNDAAGADSSYFFPGSRDIRISSYSFTTTSPAIQFLDNSEDSSYYELKYTGFNFVANENIGDFSGRMTSAVLLERKSGSAVDIPVIDLSIDFGDSGLSSVILPSGFSFSPDSLLNTYGLASYGVVLSLVGNSGADRLYGSARADILDGKGGADLLVGHGGNDTYQVDNAGDEVVEFRNEGTDTVISSSSYALASGQEIETLRTSNDFGTTKLKLIGNEFANKIVGNDGANTLDGGRGADSLYGKGGNDTFLVDAAGDKVYELKGDGDDTVKVAVSYTLASGQSIETLRTTSDGGKAAIKLTGNEIANTIVGNDGANVITGGGGADVLYGKEGADTFLFKAIADSKVASTGRDTIQDFSQAQHDRIDLHLIDAVAGGSVNQAFNFIGAAAFGDHAGELRAVKSGGDTLISGDVDGNGSADFSILQKGALTLHSSDFIL